MGRRSEAELGYHVTAIVLALDLHSIKLYTSPDTFVLVLNMLVSNRQRRRQYRKRIALLRINSSFKNEPLEHQINSCIGFERQFHQSKEVKILNRVMLDSNSDDRSTKFVEASCIGQSDFWFFSEHLVS